MRRGRGTGESSIYKGIYLNALRERSVCEAKLNLSCASRISSFARDDVECVRTRVREGGRVTLHGVRKKIGRMLIVRPGIDAFSRRGGLPNLSDVCILRERERALLQGFALCFNPQLV